MLSRLYDYKSLGKAFNYQLVNSYSVIDLVKEECKAEYVVTVDFTLKMIGKNLTGGSVFDLHITHLSLPIELHEALSVSSIKFLYNFQDVTDHLVILLQGNGEIAEIENIDEIKTKWNALKAELLLASPTPETDDLLANGEIAFGASFGFSQDILKRPFYSLLFPGFYNQFINTEETFPKKEINSFFFPEITYTIESGFNVQPDKVTVDAFLYPDDVPAIKKRIEEVDQEIEITNLYYKEVTEYQLDAGDHIQRAESIQIESLNGTDEVINNMILTAR